MDETAFWLPRGFEKEHKFLSNTGDGNTRAKDVIAAVVSDHSICLWTAHRGTLWTKQNTHMLTLRWAAGVSDLKLRILSIVVLLDTTKWMCGTVRTYTMCKYFAYFVVAFHLLLLSFRILYSDHLLLDETRFYFCCPVWTSFIMLRLYAELCRTL